MSRDKLLKFRELDDMQCVLQYPIQSLNQANVQLPSHWNETFFHNDNPIILELGCGYGEYTVRLAEMNPDQNFIGIDIKGARLWHGAKYVETNKLHNVIFLRTQIEMLSRFFSPGEVSQIWLTFPDPQMRKSSKRLISPDFFHRYCQILIPNGDIFLKTDSNFLYQYTLELLKINKIVVLENVPNLYPSGKVSNFGDKVSILANKERVGDVGNAPCVSSKDIPSYITDIQTHYETQWMQRGISIKYLHWQLPHLSEFVEPQVDIERDTYKSYGRGTL